jgi:hypothetical protein
MNDDYLWDRTGEPDPDIQQVEQVLGTLRYQPRPLELPTHSRIGRPRTFIARVAVAAAVAAMLIGVASWLALRRQDVPIGPVAESQPQPIENLKSAPVNVAAPAKGELAESGIINRQPETKLRQSGIKKSQVAGNKQFRSIKPFNKPFNSELSARDHVEAQAAKAQLLLALRVASSKLNFAQKRAQGAYPGSLIRNQHKVG